MFSRLPLTRSQTKRRGHLIAALLALAFIPHACALPQPESAPDQPQLLLQTGHSGSATGIAFSPDGVRIASASWDKTIRIWNRNTGLLVQVIHVPRLYLNTIAWSPNGRVLAVVGGDSLVFDRLELWDAWTGNLIRELKGHTGPIRSVAFSPDGKNLASAGADNTVRVWDVESGAQLAIFTGNKYKVGPISYSNNGITIAKQSLDDSVVTQWNPRTGLLRETHSLGPTGANLWINGYRTAVAPNGASLAVPTSNGKMGIGVITEIQLWNAHTGRRIWVLPVSSRVWLRLAFSRDGKTLASSFTGASKDSTIQLWDVETGRRKLTIAQEDGEFVTQMAFSPDGRSLAVAFFGGTVRLWNATTGKPERTWAAFYDKSRSIAYSPEGGMLAVFTGASTTTLQLWDPHTGALNRAIPVGGAEIFGLAISPNWKEFATVTQDFKVSVWDLGAGTVTTQLSRPEEVPGELFPSAQALAYSPTGRQLAAEGGSKVELFNVTGPPAATSFDAARAPLAYSPDGKRIALKIPNPAPAAQEFGSFPTDYLDLIDPAHQAATVRLTPGSAILRIAFSPDSRLVATAGLNFHSSLKLWDASSGALLRTIPTPDAIFSDLSFSHDGKWVAAGSWNDHIQLWDAATGEPRGSIGPSSGAFAFSPNDKIIVGGGKDGPIHFWDIQTGRILLSLVVFPPTVDGGKPEWIAFNPEGYYDASPGAAPFIGWRWKDRLYPASRFEATFHRPDRVSEALRNQ